jgi:hypothetical protein
LVATNLIATLLVPAIFIATALGGRNIMALVFAIASWVTAGRDDLVRGVAECDSRSLASGVTEIRQNFLRLHLTLTQGRQIISNGFFFVEPDLAGVGADEAFVEYAAGKLVEVFFFERAEHARADFCSVRDGVERESALLALLAKFFPECAQGPLRRTELNLRPASK